MLKNKAISRFIVNLSYAFAAQIISLALSILMSLIVPKLLGVEEFGYWQLFIFYGSYVGFFHFGLTDGVYLKYGGLSYDKINKSILGSQFWLLTFMQLVLFIGILAYSTMLVADNQRSFVLIMTGVYMVFSNMIWYLGYIFQATNEIRTYSASVIIDKAVFILVLIVLIILHISQFQMYVILFMLGKIISLVYCIYKGKAIVFARWTSLQKTICAAASNIKIGINLTLSSIASILILGFGRFLVDKSWGITAFGKFSFSLSLANLFLLFISQVSMVLFPALRQADKEQMKKYYSYIRNALSLFLPLILFIYIPLKFLLGLWLPQYQESLRYLALLLPLCTYDGKMQMLCNTYFKVLRKERLLFALNIKSMILSIILSIIGAYVVKSIYFIVISMVVAVAFRSIISEIRLAGFMNAYIYKSLIFELLLTVIFMLSTWYLNSLLSFIIFFIAYTVYLKINNKNLKMVFRFSKSLLRKA